MFRATERAGFNAAGANTPVLGCVDSHLRLVSLSPICFSPGPR